MTEAEWLACDNDPVKMWRFLDGKASARKFRLFAVACCRRIWPLLLERESRQAVEVAESYADGIAARGQLKAAWAAADQVAEQIDENLDWEAPATRALEQRRRSYHAALAATWSAFSNGRDAALHAAHYAAQAKKGVAERVGQARLWCDLLNEQDFPAVSVAPAWLSWNDGFLPELARDIYENRTLPAGILDNDRLAVLGDALEEAGCDNADILNHCRQPGIHVRGCWVVDSLLGKS
jgi:hypothetical protein